MDDVENTDKEDHCFLFRNRAQSANVPLRRTTRKSISDKKDLFVLDQEHNNNKNKVDNDDNNVHGFFEPCSRPQTSSGQMDATSIKLSYYENDEDSFLANSGVITLKTTDPDVKTLIREKSTYDLVFKTDDNNNNSYWFDNDASECFNTMSSTCSSSNVKPLNITILDPVESEINADYRHLFFENNDILKNNNNSNNLELSEVNLKTSVPCADFTTLGLGVAPSRARRLVEKGSKVSLFDYRIDKDGNNKSVENGAEVT